MKIYRKVYIYIFSTKKKKYKKAKWLSEEALQISEKRRKLKGKGGGERYTQLNVEFQRIARRHKKTFSREQCKETEENNRMGKTRDFFKKIEDIKQIFQARIDTIKDITSKDLTETKDTKKKWHEYTELSKKGLNNLDNHNVVVTHLEPDT